jgi:hypothetical protein
MKPFGLYDARDYPEFLRVPSWRTIYSVNPSSNAPRRLHCLVQAMGLNMSTCRSRPIHRNGPSAQGSCDHIPFQLSRALSVIQGVGGKLSLFFGNDELFMVHICCLNQI